MIDTYAFLRGKAGEVDKFFEGKSANIEKQTLKEHVDKALKALDEVKDSRIWKYTVKLFEGDEHLVEEYLKIIILFHDIGKIFHQANIFLDKEKGIKYLNFKGHEYFSTYLADEYLRLEDCRLDRLLILSAILYHHHAMGLKERGKIRELRVCKTKGEYDVICKTVGNILRSYGLRVNEFLRYLRNVELENKNKIFVLKQRFVNNVYKEVDGINREIWNNFIRDRTFRRKLLIFTVILQICDYKGSKGRTRNPPKFYNVLKEFIELYKKFNFNKINE